MGLTYEVVAEQKYPDGFVDEKRFTVVSIFRIEQGKMVSCDLVTGRSSTHTYAEQQVRFTHPALAHIRVVLQQIHRPSKTRIKRIWTAPSRDAKPLLVQLEEWSSTRLYLRLFLVPRGLRSIVFFEAPWSPSNEE